jgi:hypothetical protein
MTWWFSRDTEGTDGWEHGLPPGIATAQWPRHRASGLPLVHGFTIRLPGAFQVRGAALSYFHPGDSESFPPDEEAAARVSAILDGAPLARQEAGHPFWEALAAHRPHPTAMAFTDILEHDHVLIWQRDDESVAGPRCPRPDTPLPDGIDGEATHLYEPVLEAVPLGRVESEPEPLLIQLGWPLHPVQLEEKDLREMGFGEKVLEIQADVGGANYGDGSCQIDLEHGLLRWSCR